MPYIHTLIVHVRQAKHVLQVQLGQKRMHVQLP